MAGEITSDIKIPYGTISVHAGPASQEAGEHHKRQRIAGLRLPNDGRGYTMRSRHWPGPAGFRTKV